MDDKNKKSGFYLLSDNTDAFVARFALATLAEKTLDIQYYIMHNDASGQYLAYAILAAADRGVKIRILVDDINLSGRDSNLKLLDKHDNIEICIFNPLVSRNWFRIIELVINLDRAGRRMHNKAFIADNSVAIIGGRNIGDEYFDARHSLNFVDLDLLSIGPIVNDISQSFNAYWQSRWATSVAQLSKTRVVKKQLSGIRNQLKDRWHRARNTAYFQSLKQSDLTQKILNQDIHFIWAEAKLFYDQPEKVAQNHNTKLIHFGPHIMPYFEQASNELLITSPYFVPGAEGLHWLLKKQQSGTRIKVITNSLASTDVIAVHAGYQKYRKQLIQAGVSLFELKTTAAPLRKKAGKWLKGISSSSLHAKYMIVDQRYVFIGSANIDPRSKSLNTEIGIMVDSKELAQQAKQLFTRTANPENCHQLVINPVNNKLNWLTREHDKETRYAREPGVSMLKKLGVFILALLPIESLL